MLRAVWGPKQWLNYSLPLLFLLLSFQLFFFLFGYIFVCLFLLYLFFLSSLLPWMWRTSLVHREMFSEVLNRSMKGNGLRRADVWDRTQSSKGAYKMHLMFSLRFCLFSLQILHYRLCCVITGSSTLPFSGCVALCKLINPSGSPFLHLWESNTELAHLLPPALYLRSYEITHNSISVKLDAGYLW